MVDGGGRGVGEGGRCLEASVGVVVAAAASRRESEAVVVVVVVVAVVVRVRVRKDGGRFEDEVRGWSWREGGQSQGLLSMCARRR